MKTIKEQIEVMQHFDNGGKVKRMHKRGLEVIIYDNKDHRARLSFNWNDYDYEIHKEVKPLFPNKEQGAKYAVNLAGLAFEILLMPNNVELAALQGRTFYTQEDAELFVRREQAKTHCLEAINRVNKGDNGFKYREPNYVFMYDHNEDCIEFLKYLANQHSHLNEYIRTEEAAKELINDPEFVENWKCWKGVE